MAAAAYIGMASDKGRERADNQDFYGRASLPYGELLVVADGMGGHTGGSTASRLAVQAVLDFAHSFRADANNPESFKEMLFYSIVQANHAVHSRAEQHPELKGMGTTLVLALVVGMDVYVAHVGDSRLYHLTPEAERVTVDHTTVQEMVDHNIITPAQAKAHPDAHKLLRAIGHRPEVDPEVRPGPVRLGPGQAILLCTDGLYDVVSEDEIAKVLQAYRPQRACDALVALANDRGGPDNVTILLYKLPGGEKRTVGQTLVDAGTHRVGRFSIATWFGLAAALVIAVALALYLYPPSKDKDGPGPRDDNGSRHTDPGRRPSQGDGQRQTGGPDVRESGEASTPGAGTASDQGGGATGPGQPRQGGDTGGNKMIILDGGEEPGGTTPTTAPGGQGTKPGGKLPPPRQPAGKGGTNLPGPAAVGTCDPVGMKWNPQQTEQANDILRMYHEAEPKVGSPEKHYLAEQGYRKMAKSLKTADPEVGKYCGTTVRNFAQKCKDGRLKVIAHRVQWFQCSAGCHEALQGLRLGEDSVVVEELLLAPNDAKAALGKCIDDTADLCAKVRVQLGLPEKPPGRPAEKSDAGPAETKADPNAITGNAPATGGAAGAGGAAAPVNAAGPDAQCDSASGENL